MTTDNFGFYLQNRLIQTGQTGGQWYIDTSPFSIPWLKGMNLIPLGVLMASTDLFNHRDSNSVACTIKLFMAVIFAAL
jgi:hypothetical protein